MDSRVSLQLEKSPVEISSRLLLATDLRSYEYIGRRNQTRQGLRSKTYSNWMDWSDENKPSGSCLNRLTSIILDAKRKCVLLWAFGQYQIEKFVSYKVFSFCWFSSKPLGTVVSFNASIPKISRSRKPSSMSSGSAPGWLPPNCNSVNAGAPESKFLVNSVM